MTGSPFAPTDGPLTFEEALATRNRGMPLEALRYDVTPTALHYLLIHFDIPFADEDAWRVEVDGAVHVPLSLSMTQIRALPRAEHLVTMECAGNGRVRLHPRPLSQPWVHEAVGTARWAGTPLRGVLEQAGVEPDAVEVVSRMRARALMIPPGIPDFFARTRVWTPDRWCCAAGRGSFDGRRRRASTRYRAGQPTPQGLLNRSTNRGTTGASATTGSRRCR